jgi:hypothetical protein
MQGAFNVLSYEARPVYEHEPTSCDEVPVPFASSSGPLSNVPRAFVSTTQRTQLRLQLQSTLDQLTLVPAVNQILAQTLTRILTQILN